MIDSAEIEPKAPAAAPKPMKIDWSATFSAIRKQFIELNQLYKAKEIDYHPPTYKSTAFEVFWSYTQEYLAKTHNQGVGDTSFFSKEKAPTPWFNTNGAALLGLSTYMIRETIDNHLHNLEKAGFIKSLERKGHLIRSDDYERRIYINPKYLYYMET
jgi:hypothetical protein